MSKIKVGIFFGGPSREREISFAGGRTVYDNLNKSIFEAIPIFVDSNKTLIKLDWSYIYKGTIRDFYPPVSHIPTSKNNFQIYLESIKDLSTDQYDDIIQNVGQKIDFEHLNQEIDIAFLALHGEYGEDGQIQGILDGLQIPYTGSGLLPCAIGMNKDIQKNLMSKAGFACPKILKLHRSDYSTIELGSLYARILNEIGTSFVIRPANQGSSIGVSILHDPTFEEFTKQLNKAFFIQIINKQDWQSLNDLNKVNLVKDLSDLRSGLGFPIKSGKTTIYHPEALLDYLEENFANGASSIKLESYHQEHTVIFESFIEGKEFSCIVIRNEEGKAIALPPTEIRKQGQLYDYKSKYLPGLSRKITPIDLPREQINNIRKECEKLFEFLSFHTYARIDGFFTPNEKILLNDPNTTSGMMPSSFFFHQAAEIGLDPSQFLSYIIRTSLVERKKELLYYQRNIDDLIERIDAKLSQLNQPNSDKKNVAVILGGYSFERHISVESGRNIYEKLASSDKYLPIPYFLKKGTNGDELYQIPISLLLKDNADDIRDKILSFNTHPVIHEIRSDCSTIMSKYSSPNNVTEPKFTSFEELAEIVDAAFIALHGRPGEDGTIQKSLSKVGIPFNGSPSSSSEVTIHKYNTLQILKENGFPVTKQKIWTKNQYKEDHNQILTSITSEFSFPFILKPVDDGCSSAVVMIKDTFSLSHYLDCIFRDGPNISSELRNHLGLAYNEEFPQKDEVLVEALIGANGASHFLEITGGLLTHRQNGTTKFEIFEPSEALSGGEILSLEEKFLAGEGQNLTPARFGDDYDFVADKVKEDLQKAAEILGVEGYARIDAFVRIYDDKKVETVIIEVNSLPGMTPATCIFHQTALNGYKPYDFIDKILQFAINE